MNTLDLYIDYLQSKLTDQTIKAAERGAIAAIYRVNAPQEAIAFANEHGLTVRHLTPENRKKRDERAVEIARELWFEQNADDYDWAKMAWAEITMPDDWGHEALALLEEAYTIMDKEKTDD